MLKRYYKSLLIYLIITTIPISAQSVSKITQTISIKEGLSQNSILQLEQDSLGFLWIGTEVGLSRWNGTEVINYPSTKNYSLPGGFIRSLYSDHNGILWVIPGDGKLYFKNRDSDIFSLSKMNMTSINSNIKLITSNKTTNSLILFTDDNKVYNWNYTKDNPELITDFRHKNVKEAYWYNNDMLIASDRGWLFINSQNEVISKVDLEWLDNSENPIYDIEEVDNVIYASRGDWGITTHTQDAKTYNNIPVESKYIIKDYHNQLISSNNSNTLTLIYDLNKIKMLPILKPEGLEISSFLKLRTGQIVIGSTVSGLWIMDPFKPFFTTPSQEELNNKNVTSIIEGSTNELWLSTYNEGILYYNTTDNKLKEYNTNNETLYSNNISFLTIDSSNRLWAASNDRGFFIYNRDKDIFESPLKNGLKDIIFSNLKVNHIEEKDNETLLLSTPKGLYEFNIKSKTTTKLYDKNVWASLIDINNNIWIATEHGVLKNIGDIFIEIGQYMETVWFLTEVKNGDIIAGTPSGLYIFSKKGELYHFNNLEKYLYNKSIYNVIVDKLGFYWITTNSGIVRWDRKDDSIDIFTTIDGLLSNEFNLYSGIVRYNNNLIFGGLSGINEINPEKVISNPYPTKIIIDKLQKISYSDQLLENRYTTESYIDSIIVKPDENILRVGFQTIEYHDLHEIVIKYQLEGLSNSWVDVSNEKNILFVNLSPKNYKLNILATNATDIIPYTKSINITVKPHFIETRLFKLLILLLLLFLILIIILYINKMKKEIILRRAAEHKYSRLNTHLEKVLDTRTNELKISNNRIIQQEKMSSLGQLVAGVAHEINTPLGVAVLSNSFIQDNVEKIYSKFQKNTLTKKDLAEGVDELQQATEQLTYNLDKASNLIRNFKQVAVDKNTDDIIRFNLGSSIESLLSSLNNKLKLEHVNVDFKIDQNFIIYSYPSEISQIITNLIMNSIYHGFDKKFKKDNKIITIDIYKEEDTCIIKFVDNGVGICKKNIKKIFDPFFTTNRSSGGTGLGLNIVYNIIKEKLNGNIDVTSQEHEYTQFLISIPINM